MLIGESHPVRGAWIEITWTKTPLPLMLSHPVRGAWIEIAKSHGIEVAYVVAPRQGCVD